MNHCPAGLLAAAAVVLTLFSGEVFAERVWTKREVEMRSTPGEDSYVVRKVKKGKSLEVERRLGTWVMVAYNGRTGWVRRSHLSSSVVRAEKKRRSTSERARTKTDRKSRKADRAASKRTAKDDDKKGKKSGTKRTGRARVRRIREKRADKDPVRTAADRDDAALDEDDMKPRRERSTWSVRGKPGDVLKAKIKKLRVQAFSEQDGRGKVVFTARAGDTVRVKARGENRWLMVERKGKTGWIPVTAVKDHGRFDNVRGDAPSDDDGDESAADGDESAADEPKRAASSDSGEAKASAKTSVRLSSKTADDDGDTESAATASDVTRSSGGIAGVSGKDKSSKLRLRGGLRAGFSAVSMKTVPDEAAAEGKASYSGPTAGVVGEVAYPLTRAFGVSFEASYDWSTALGGATYTTAMDEVSDISLSHHRAGAALGATYGTSWVVTGRLGYHYSSLQISDVENDAKLPRESMTGPTAGLGFAMDSVAGTKFGARAGLDALLAGSRRQTETLRDGQSVDSLIALWTSLEVSYLIAPRLTVGGGYRFGYAQTEWSGESERLTGVMAAARDDLSHELSLGVGVQL